MLEKTKELKSNIANPGSERALISICLKNPDKMVDIEAEEIYADHFGIKAHRYIFMSILYLYSKKIKPTPVAIMEVLVDKKAKETIEEIGGLDYIDTLSQMETIDDNYKIFCKKVKQAHIRRTIYDLCEETKGFILSEESEVLNPSELVSQLEQKVMDIGVKNTNTNDIYKMGDDTDAILAQREESPSVVPGIETGWVRFDAYTSGGRPGDLIVVCARSKTGKSVTLTNWATKIGIIDKLPILYIDTEMNHREQEDRMLSSLSGIPYNEIISGMYVLDTVNGTAKEKREQLEKAKLMLKEGQYYHIYMPQFTYDKVVSLTRKFQLQHGIVALFFDYIKLSANQTATLKSMQEWQSLGFFTSGLKDIAGMLQIPVYTACQENRSNPKSKEKDETNVGGSDRILQLATKLCFLYNKDEEDILKEGIQNGNQQLYIAYQRNGQSDCPPINIFFDKPRLLQREC